MTNIKPTKADINKKIQHQLFYFKNQQKIIDANKTKQALISTRKQWLDLQKIYNYQSEYDRIRNSLASSTAAQHGSPTTDHLEKRKLALENLGVSSLRTMS